MRRAAAALRAAGFSPVAVNYEAVCGPAHARIGSLDSWRGLPAAIDVVRSRRPGPVYAVGWSMGGSLLLKLLGEHPDLVAAAIAIHSPVDFTGTVQELERRDKGMWTTVIAQGIKGKFMRSALNPAFLELLASRGVSPFRFLKAKTLRDVEAAVVCPFVGSNSTI